MWYVIQTQSGREAYVQQLIECNVDALCFEEVFSPRREAMKRVRGRWYRREELLIPGYLFVITNEADELARQLRRVPAFTRLLGNDDFFIPLPDDEVAFIDAFTSSQHRIVDMSEGVVEGDRIVVLKGPLTGQEGRIAHIDRHRRCATLELQFMGREKLVKVGLEIVHKR